MEIEDQLKAYFKNQIKDINTDINVEEVVMSKIITPKRRTAPKKLLLIAAIVTMLFCSTALAYGKEVVSIMQNMNFKNDKGKVEWTITYSKENRSYGDIAHEVFENLNLDEGKAVAIYVAKNNPYNDIVSEQKPIKIQDIDLINSYKIGNQNFKFEKNILQKYQFKNGTIQNELENLSFNDIEKIRKEAKKSGREVIVNDVMVTKNIDEISCDYYKNNVKSNRPDFTFYILKWNGSDMTRSADEKDNLVAYDSVMVGNSEVLYEARQDIKNITWLNDEYYYCVSSKKKDMTKEELLRIVEFIKTK